MLESFCLAFTNVKIAQVYFIAKFAVKFLRL